MTALKMHNGHVYRFHTKNAWGVEKHMLKKKWIKKKKPLKKNLKQSLEVCSGKKKMKKKRFKRTPFLWVNTKQFAHFWIRFL